MTIISVDKNSSPGLGIEQKWYKILSTIKELDFIFSFYNIFKIRYE